MLRVRRTFAITDTKFSPEGVRNNEVDSIWVDKILFFVSKPQWSQNPTRVSTHPMLLAILDNSIWKHLIVDSKE